MSASKRPADARIVACAALPQDQARLVRAALVMDGSDLSRFAATEKLSYSRLTRMVRGEESVSAAYAARLDRLVQRRLLTPVARLAA